MIFTFAGVVALMAAVVSVGMLVIAGVRGDRQPVVLFTVGLIVSLAVVAAAVFEASS